MSELRIGLVGFHSRTGEVFKSLGLNVVAHIFANPENKRANFPDNPERINFHDWKYYNTRSRTAPTDAAEVKLKTKGACFDDFIRCTDRWDWSRELINDWSDYEHLFSLAFDHAWHWLQDNRIGAVIYSNVPHQGIAVVQYHLARILGIKTRIFLQSPFPGRSWLVEHWDDLGTFKSLPAAEPFEIDVSKPESQPFYMDTVRGDVHRHTRTFLHKFRARSVIGLGLTGISQEGRRRSFQRNMNRWQRAVQDEFYLRNANSYFSDTPSDEPYVYFPLHLQPEMTTDILGGMYADQLTALETLRDKIPDEISIYVKENPKQMGRLRGEAFFKRLTGIRNVKLLSRKVSSFELIENSLAVATISGTAGWEALKSGKPAIVFGATFWNRLPGAFRVDNRLDWKKVNSFKFDAAKLEAAVSNISRHAYPGICDPTYSVLTDSYNQKQNSETLARTLLNWGNL